MNDCDALLRAVLWEAEALGIPVSRNIDPQVKLNRRAARRFGCCRFREGRFEIEVAQRLAEGPEAGCQETLAHEVLHTCYGCRNHGKRWQSYAEKMNAAYGYSIARTSTSEKMGVEELRSPNYILRCNQCGTEFGRLRASLLTRHPECYRCKCGGTLARVR